MRCHEKLDLQRACTAAWESYETYAREAGIPAAFAGGLPPDRVSPAYRDLSTTYRNATRLRSEHLKASHALSVHLARHHC